MNRHKQHFCPGCEYTSSFWWKHCSSVYWKFWSKAKIGIRIKYE